MHRPDSFSCRKFPYPKNKYSELPRFRNFAKTAKVVPHPQERRMRDGLKERTKQLCEAIVSEQNANRFMELVSELNRILIENEDAAQQARAVNEVAE